MPSAPVDSRRGISSCSRRLAPGSRWGRCCCGGDSDNGGHGGHGGNGNGGHRDNGNGGHGDNGITQRRRETEILVVQIVVGLRYSVSLCDPVISVTSVPVIS